MWRRKSNVNKKEECEPTTYVDNECLSHKTRNQMRCLLLKKDNEESVMIERKGSLTIGDETKGVMFVNDLTNNTLCHIN